MTEQADRTTDRRLCSPSPKDISYLVKERHGWREAMLNGTWQDPHLLAVYRENRMSNLWRSSRQAEQLCEYILHLEALVEK